MVTHTRQYTVDEFDAFIERPENADRLFEYIGGEIVEVVSNNYASEVAARILIKIGVYVESHNAGRVTGADGGYKVSGERYIPEVAFVSRQKQPIPSHETYNTNPPDLAVEALSPSNDPGDIRIKVSNYLAAGTVVWVVNSEEKYVEVHTPGQPAKRLSEKDTLDGGTVLPDFILAVKDIFPAE